MSATDATVARDMPSPPGPHTDADGVRHAMGSFASQFGALAALRLESCIHCGMCADACHFYIADGDPRYTPIWKVEPFKQAYKRESGPFAPIFRWLGLKHEVTADELEDWQHLLYDSCNLCSRCSLICPMGIDVASLIEEARHGMFEAGLAPDALYQAAENQHESGSPHPVEEPWVEQLRAIGRAHDVAIPVNREQADVLLCVSAVEIERYPDQVAALARVMAHLGVACTFRSDAVLADNYAYYAGGLDWQRDISQRVIDQAQTCGATTVIVPECGHSYTTLRWEAAELYGRALPFEVLHITEYLAARLQAGELKLRRDEEATSTVFHDPCQVVRKGGVMEAPRQLLAAMGVEVRERDDHRGFGFCCGGGGGVMMLETATPLRRRALENRIRDIDATGADQLTTSCAGCRMSFDDAHDHFDWDKSPQSLLALVADHLAPREDTSA